MTTYKRAVCPYCKEIDNSNPKNIDLMNKQCCNCNKVYRIVKIGKCMYRNYRLEELEKE